MRNVVLLGSTGSIGTSTIKVAEDLPEKIRLVGLAAGNNVELLAEQTRTHRPNAISIFDPAKAKQLESSLDGKTKIYSGAERQLIFGSAYGSDVIPGRAAVKLNLSVALLAGCLIDFLRANETGVVLNI